MSSPLFRLDNLEREYAIARTRRFVEPPGPSFRLSISHLDIHENRTLALIGPTGAGKTTLLKLLIGALSDYSGHIEFGGKPLATAITHVATRRRMSMVFQNPILLSGSVRFNIEYGLRLRRVTDKRKRVAALLDELGLVALAEQAAHTLSGGQKQLVAIARALIVQPDVLLLDEPTAHLDPTRVQLVERLIRSYCETHPTTIIWSTHQLFQARRIAHDTAFLLNGGLIEVNETETLFSRPADSRTAAFIEGKMIY